MYEFMYQGHQSIDAMDLKISPHDPRVFEYLRAEDRNV